VRRSLGAHTLSQGRLICSGLVAWWYMQLHFKYILLTFSDLLSKYFAAFHYSPRRLKIKTIFLSFSIPTLANPPSIQNVFPPRNRRPHSQKTVNIPLQRHHHLHLHIRHFPLANRSFFLSFKKSTSRPLIPQTLHHLRPAARSSQRTPFNSLSHHLQSLHHPLVFPNMCYWK
jgi:hypothetical protein